MAQRNVVTMGHGPKPSIVAHLSMTLSKVDPYCGRPNPRRLVFSEGLRWTGMVKYMEAYVFLFCGQARFSTSRTVLHTTAPP